MSVCYNLERVQPYGKLEDLCVWKPAKHTSLETKKNVQEFPMCVNCSGYDKKRDCYFSHSMMEDYLRDKQ